MDTVVVYESGVMVCEELEAIKVPGIRRCRNKSRLGINCWATPRRAKRRIPISKLLSPS
jgi:hypothetical protein